MPIPPPAPLPQPLLQLLGDGQRLAELMIDYSVGVSTRETYVLKRADEDYFAEG